MPYGTHYWRLTVSRQGRAQIQYRPRKSLPEPVQLESKNCAANLAALGFNSLQLGAFIMHCGCKPIRQPPTDQVYLLLGTFVIVAFAHRGSYLALNARYGPRAVFAIYGIRKHPPGRSAYQFDADGQCLGFAAASH